MIVETITLIPLLLPAPPTWVKYDWRPMIVDADDTLETITLNRTAPLSDETTVSFMGQGTTLSFIRTLPFDDQMSERESAFGSLISEIISYRNLVESQDGEASTWNIDRAISDAVSLIDAIPSTAPLPRPMLLSERVAIYWDYGNTYAEIDFDGSNFFDAYGKREGVPDVHLDRFPIASADGYISFPSQIEGVISTAKETATA